MTLPLNHLSERHGLIMAQLACDMTLPRRMGWANAHAVRAQHDAELLAIYASAVGRAAYQPAPARRCHLRLVKG